ncbi:hypothetical protein [Streptomyces boncukensis]|uniref:Uncharacterized protein n=1 Tax=Streptomyces boncukensis TaxID=2711219 RepID=A0A6G4WUI5_9ACTN|nr:hypothetical protein [Streptomyces boncukensis]NGO68512.1 hypothetical protein [Streptomyces boncukensis]
MTLGLCRQFHCLPSALEDEDVSVLRLLAIERLGTPDEPDPDQGGGEYE